MSAKHAPQAHDDAAGPGFDERDARERTGHALHFLTRVTERTAEEEQTLALRLYHDRELVRRIIDEARAHAPEAQAAGDDERGRYALPLGEDADCAHAVVSADLGFVTLLGRGMHTSTLPRVPWERVRLHLQRREREQGEYQRISALLKEASTGPLLKRIVAGGLRITRQEFLRLADLAPVFSSEYLRYGIDGFISVEEHGPWAARRIKKVRPGDEKGLRAFWHIVHEMGNALALTGVRGRKGFAYWIEESAKGFGEDGRRFDLFRDIYLSAAGVGYMPTTLRALWAVARAGSDALRSCKDALREARRLEEWSAATAALVAIGARHRKLRAECAKALDPARLYEPWKKLDWMVQQAEFAWRVLSEEMLLPFDFDPHEDPAAHGRAIDEVYGIACDEQNKLRPFPGMEGLMALPDELKLAGLFHMPIVGATSLFGSLLALMTAVTAPAEAAELYFDEAEIHRAPEYSQEAALVISTKWSTLLKEPVRAQPKVGRNEPCPCGSGQKYKRCCAA